MSGIDPPDELVAAVSGLLQAGGQSRIRTWQRMPVASRHELWRVGTADGTFVAKVYRAEVDQYFQHRWRREERALDLAGRHAPGLGPATFGGLAVPDRWAVLVLEDLAGSSVAERLSEATPAQRRRLLRLGLDALAAFRSLTRDHAGLFRAVANQSDLDRLTHTTIARRLAIAVARLRNADVRPDPTVQPRTLAPELPWQYLRAEVVRPLVRTRRRVIHNGFSPLNLVDVGDRLRVVDWETVALAAPEFDLADLLTFPGWRQDPGDGYRTAGEVGLTAAREPDHDRVFWLACAERALTYAATAHVRAARAGAADRAANLLRRDAYLDTLTLAFDRAGLTSGPARSLLDLVRAAAPPGD